MIIPGVVAAYRANYLVPAACDDHWDDVVLAMHMDDDIVDASSPSSGASVTGTEIYAPGKYGSAFSFNGASHIVVASESTKFDFGVAPVTIEMYYRITASGYNTVFALPNGISGVYIYSFVSGGMKHVQFSLLLSGAATNYTFNTGYPSSYDGYIHLAIVRSGASIYFFIDGELKLTGATAAHVPLGLPNTTALIGASATDGSNSYTGYIDDLRITKGVARYTANFTPPTAPFETVQCGPDPTGGSAVVVPGPGVPCEPNFAKMVLALHMNGADGTNTFTDETGKTPASLVNTPLIKTNNSKFGGASAYFDGKSAVVFGASADFALTKDFTVSFWLSPTYLGTQILGTGATGNGFYVFSSSAYPGEITLYHAGAYRTTSGAALPINAWTHIEISRSGTSINLFVNGISRLQYNSILPFGSTTAPMVIGSHYHAFKTPVSLFYGYLDDVFIMAGHAQHTSNFAVPVDPFGAACP